jgi:hypothetical protein
MIATAVFRDASLLSQKKYITFADSVRRLVRNIEINVFPFPGPPDSQRRLGGDTIQALYSSVDVIHSHVPSTLTPFAVMIASR